MERRNENESSRDRGTPPKLESALSPGEAREAFRVLGVGAGSPERTETARVTLDWLITELEAALALPGAKELPCRDCGHDFTPAFATDHRLECSDHPARRELDVRRLVVCRLTELAEQLGLPPVSVEDAFHERLKQAYWGGPKPPRRSWYYLHEPRTLRGLLEPFRATSRERRRPLTKDEEEKLGAALETWERHLHRETDPCPYCGAVLPLELVARHVRGCSRSPAHEGIRLADALLIEALGKVRARAWKARVAERQRYLDALFSLRIACDSFDCGLGCGDDDLYAEDYEEERLQRACERAKKALEPRARPVEELWPDAALVAPELASRFRDDRSLAREALQTLLGAARTLMYGAGDDYRCRMSISRGSAAVFRAAWKRAEATHDLIAPSPTRRPTRGGLAPQSPVLVEETGPSEPGPTPVPWQHPRSAPSVSNEDASAGVSAEQPAALVPYLAPEPPLRVMYGAWREDLDTTLPPGEPQEQPAPPSASPSDPMWIVATFATVVVFYVAFKVESARFLCVVLGVPMLAGLFAALRVGVNTSRARSSGRSA